MKKATGIVLASMLAVSLVMVGCGGNNSQTANSDNGKGSKGGGTLIFARGGDSVGLDPANVTDGESARVTENIFDTLVQYKKDSTEIEPALATKWDTSADGKTWTFTLRDGVKFQDGTEFNADAVVFNFQRWMDKSNPYHNGGNFDYFANMFGGYKGDKTLVIQDVSAVDKTHVKFSLTQPQAPFLANLAMFPFAIGSPDAIKKYGDKFGQNPVGTGAFTFKEWKQNDSITIEKNKDYWRASEGLPKLDKVIFKVIPDNSARLTALQSGEVDLIDGMNPSDVQKVEGDAKLQLFKRPSMNVGYLAFNTTKKPFDNVKVRQALSMAVNKKGLIDAFYGGLAEPAATLLPSSIWGHNGDVKDYDYSLDAAKKLLADAGYPKGFSVEFLAMPVARPYMPQAQKIAESMQADFNKIGVQTKIVSMEWATYLKKMHSGDYDMGLLGWTGDNGDPDNFLYVMASKDNAKPPSASNTALYSNDKVSALLTQAQTTTDKSAREALYKQAESMIHDDAPYIPLVHSTPPMAGIKELKGFLPHATGADKLTDVSIEK